jgi:predicted short-subunit dehydrogenase-like oxidoreductase (DUF2520 family)
MDIVIIGTGNTANVLGKKLKAAGHQIVQIYGRDASAASDLAYEIDTESTNYWSVVNKNADMYILAVSDISIEEVTRELHLQDQVIVHTAGAVSRDILKNTSSHFGVFYPLQSLKKGSAYLPETPILIDANDEETLRELLSVAESISHSVVKADDEQRLKLHLAAVFCNNFVNHIYVLMEAYCKKEGLDFKLLIPLIQETAQRLDTMSPSIAQTGPAVRNDTATIEKHLKLLEADPSLKMLYQALTQSIQQQV